MNSFSYLEPVCCSMSSSNCCFLTCIQIFQEADQEVWYSHLFQNFPQFIVIHTVKGFGMVNKAEIEVFLELSCFFNDPADVGNLISAPMPFLKSAWTSGSSRFTYCWSLAWRILNITLLVCEMSAFGWRRQWHPTPVLLPGKSHGQRSLVGCSPWGCKESDTTEQLVNANVTCTWISRVNMLKMTIQPKAVYKVNAISIKCQWHFFHWNRENDSRMWMEP